MPKTDERALDGDAEDTAAAAEERDVMGGGDVDPVPAPARSRRRHPLPARLAASTDGLACIACFEPLAPTHVVRVFVVGEYQSAVAHVDCQDPTGAALGFNWRRRLV